MMESRKEMFLSYIKTNITPILTDIELEKDFEGNVILPADIDKKELNGHYVGKEFKPPKWFEEVTRTNKSKALIIEKIDTISKEEQLKFCELLEHRKISTFELPKNCVILLTAKEINKEKISEEIYSLVAKI